MEYAIDDVLWLKRCALGSLRNHARHMKPSFSKIVDRFKIVLDDILEDMASGGLDIELRPDAIPLESKIAAINWLYDFLQAEKTFCENPKVREKYDDAIALTKTISLDYMFLDIAMDI